MGCVGMLAVGLASATPQFSEFNVREYGAVGDGIADDTAAIQRCLDAATNASLSIVRYHDRRLDDAVLVKTKKGAGSRVAELWVRRRPRFHTYSEDVSTSASSSNVEYALDVNPDSEDPGPTLTRSDSEVTLPW